MSTQEIIPSNSTRFPHPYPQGIDQGDDSLPIWILSCVLTPIAILTVALRLISTVRNHKRVFPADISLIIATVLFCGLWSEQIIGLQNGLGKKFYTLAPDQVGLQLKLLFAWRVTHHAAKIAAQIGIIYMLKEAWSLKNKWFRWSWWTILVLTAVSGLLAIIVDIIQCTPVAKAWDIMGTGDGYCMDGTLNILLSTIPFGVSSVMLLALPILHILFARVSGWRRTGMITLWFAGFFLTWCIGAYPTLMIYEYSAEAGALASFVNGYMMSDCEVFVAIMVAAIPGALTIRRKERTEKEESSHGIEEGQTNQEGMMPEKEN